MLNLIFWPKPYPHESPASLISRTAFHNGYSNTRSFARAIGHNVYIGHRNLIENRKLSNFFIQNKNNPYSNHDIFYSQSFRLKATHQINVSGITMPSRTYQLRAHFCPFCLQEGHWRFIQDIEFIKVCPYHQVEYLESCPKCKKKYDWTAVNGPYCACHFDLRQAEAIHSDDVGPLNVLLLFSSGDQDVIDRFFAAIDCLKYLFLTSNKIDAELFLATTIARKSKYNFYLYITHQIEHYPNLSPKTHLSPWILSRDHWISETAASFAVTLRTTDHCRCSKDNCCETIGYTFSELCYILKANRVTTRSLILSHGFEKNIIDNSVFYTRNNICRSIKNSIKDRMRVPLPETLFRDEFESIEEIHSTRHLSAKKIRELIDKGYFPDGVMHGKRGSVLIHKDALNYFDDRYITENSLSRLYSLTVPTIRRLLWKSGISASSGNPNVADLRYVYQRQHITTKVQKHLEFGAYSIKRRINMTRGPTSAWQAATIINIKRRTMHAILDSKCIATLSKLYDPQTQTFIDPENAINILISWRAEYKTNVELAKQLNINCNLLGKRFDYIPTTKPTIIGPQKFYHATICKEIERQLQLYLPMSTLTSHSHLSAYSLRHLEKSGFIKAIDSGHPAYCPKMSLYDLSEVLLQTVTC